MLIHESLENYFRTNFALVHDHNFRLDELDEMQPWEREIYVILLNQWLEEKRKEIEAAS